MSDPFSTLPSPLPQFILESIDDFSTLHRLLQVSPAVNAVFSSNYRTIIENIITEHVPQIRHLLRTTLSIRSQPLILTEKIDSIQAFIAFRRDCLWNTDRDTVLLGGISWTPRAAHSLVTTADHVQNLLAAFFKIHLTRVNGIEPYAPVKSINRPLERWPREDFKAPSCRHYDIVPCGEPSWIEEQRVLRALWRVVIHVDLQRTLRLSCGHRSDVTDLLRTWGPRCVWSEPTNTSTEYPPELSPSFIEELMCVYDFLREISAIEHLYTSPAQPKELQTLPPCPREFCATLKPAPSTDSDFDTWHQMPRELECCNKGYTLYRTSRLLESSPLIPYSFSVFRRLGLGIWDDEKMARLGLIKLSAEQQPPHVSEMYLVGPRTKTRCGLDRLTRHDLYIRWASIVGDKKVMMASLPADSIAKST